MDDVAVWVGRAVSDSDLQAIYASGTGIPVSSLSGYATNLTAYYPLNSNFNDSSSNSFNLTAGGDAVAQSQSKLGTGAYYFDQSASGKVELGSASDWQFLHNTGAKWTIATWFKRPTAFNGSSISGDISWLCETTNGSDSGISIKYDNRTGSGHDDKFACEIINESDGTVANLVINNFYPDDDDWHHLAVTFDQTLANTNLVAYLDGVQNSTTANKDQTPSDVDSGDTLRLGGGVSTHARYGNWTLDDIGIYNRVLTATEISDLVNTTLSSSTTWTQNFSSATPTAWTEDSSGGYANNLEPYKGSVNRLWFDLDDSSSNGVMGMLDLQNASYIGANPNDNKWKMRFKINLEKFDGSSTTTYIGLTDSAGNGSNGSARWAGIALIAGTGIKTVADNSNGALTGSPILGSAIAVSESTDYYVTIERTNSSTLTTTVRTGSHSGSVVGSASTITTMSGTSGLRYWKIQNSRAGNGSQNRGYVYDLEFYNASNDGALVSSLSNKLNLKAYYSMDSTSLGATRTWIDTDGEEGTGSGQYDGSNTNTGGSISWQKYDETNDEIDFKSIRNDDTKTAITKDVTVSTNGMNEAFSTSKWLMRYKVRFDTFQSNGDTNIKIRLTSFDRNTASNNDNYSSGDGCSLEFYNASTPFARFGWGKDEQVDQNNIGSDVTVSASAQTFFVEVSRDGTTLTCKCSTSAYGSTDVFEKSGTVDSDWGDSGTPLKYFGLWEGSGVGQTAYLQGAVHDMQVYNGVSALDGLKNDFSSTSDLVAMTNLPTNTIFEQTDDTPSYWWKQSDNTWKKDPKATMSEDFSSSSAWTLHSSSSISASTGITCTNSGESYRSTGLGKPTNLTWDFTWTRNSGDQGNTSALLLSSQTSGYGDPSTGHTNVQFYMANGNVTTLSVRKNSSGTNVQTECHFGVGSSSVNIQPTGTTRYYRITKDGSVWTMKKFTSASDREGNSNVEASTTATQSSTADSTWNSGSGNLTYLVVDGHGSGTKNYTISDVKIWKDLAL